MNQDVEPFNNRQLNLVEDLRKELKSIQGLTMESVLRPLKNLVQSQPNICDEYFVNALPLMWKLFKPQLQQSFLLRFHDTVCGEWPENSVTFFFILQ